MRNREVNKHWSACFSPFLFDAKSTTICFFISKIIFHFTVYEIHVFICLCTLVNSLSEVDNSTGTLSFEQNLIMKPSPYTIFTAVSSHTGLIYRWDYVLLFALLRLLQGLGGLGAGLISALRSQLWIAVDQFSTRELSVMLFKHIQR